MLFPGTWVLDFPSTAEQSAFFLQELLARKSNHLATALHTTKVAPNSDLDPSRRDVGLPQAHSFPKPLRFPRWAARGPQCATPQRPRSATNLAVSESTANHAPACPKPGVACRLLDRVASSVKIKHRVSHICIRVGLRVTSHCVLSSSTPIQRQVADRLCAKGSSINPLLGPLHLDLYITPLVAGTTSLAYHRPYIYALVPNLLIKSYPVYIPQFAVFRSCAQGT